MKVLTPGKSSSGWSKKIKCSECHAELLVEESDLYHWSHMDYSGESDTYVGFRCGHCQQENSYMVPSRVIPAYIVYRSREWK